MKTLLRHIWYHPVTVALSNIVLVMVLFTLSRLFFCWVNAPMFPDLTAAALLSKCLAGLRFDLTAVLYLSSVYLLMQLLPLPWRQYATYQTVARYMLWVPNSIGLLLNAFDSVYVQFTDRRTTCSFFREFENDQNLFSIFLQAVVQYWYVTLSVVVLIVLLCVLTRRRVLLPQHLSRTESVVYYIFETLLMCVMIYFVVIGIRGGFGRYTRPITISNAMQYVDKPVETTIVLNTPFTLMKSLENETYHDPAYFPAETLDEIYTPLHEGGAAASFDSLNVVVLILESFSREFIGYLNQDEYHTPLPSYTPFLDSLLLYSRTFTCSYASGRKSIDAMPSVLSSVPMLIEPYIVTPYSTNEVMSLASCLGAKGYTTAFYHGAPNGSMGFQAFAQAAGFDYYLGMDEYDGPQAFDGTWAIWDEEFLDFFARSMTTLQEPFFTAVFTASSHHPFRVPKRYEGRFPKGSQPLHQCIGYSDNALREFFRLSKQQPWYDHTLFVLTADHTNQLSAPQSTNAKGLFEVPIAFYMPDNTLASHANMVVSQTDIMPSVLAYLGFDEPFIAFGDDVLTTDEKAHPYAVNYLNPIFQVLSANLLLQFDGKEVVAIYDIKSDPCLTTNQVEHLLCTDEAQDMLRYLKAYIQQYISRMINNQLKVEHHNIP